MLDIDVDQIQEIEYLNTSTSEQGAVKITLRDGSTRTFEGPDVPEVLEILKHWTPPTA
jgi:hypothetical protein